MNTKWIPPILMLVAGAVTSIVTYLMHYEIKTFLWILVAVLVLFYIMGNVIKKVIGSFEAEAEKTVLDEGEVIEKEPEDAKEGEEPAAAGETGQ